MLHRCTTFFVATVALALGIAPARADLMQWQVEANAGTAPAFLGTNFATPTVVNIGSLSGDITYEFIVNGVDGSRSSALLGDITGQDQAIKFEQFDDTGLYGVTAYGFADYDFGVPTDFGADVHLAFVADAGAVTTTLFVNGVATGTPVPFSVSLTGSVGLGGTFDGITPFFEVFTGTILGFATYDSALSAAEIQTQANAFLAPAAVPEPSTLASAGIAGLIGCGVAWKRRRRAA
jgi:hypothetical protein